MPDSACPSSSTPVKQEETAAQPLEVSVEVHVVPDSEQDEADVSEGPLGMLSRMSLGGPVPVSIAEHRGRISALSEDRPDHVNGRSLQ